MVRGGGFFLVSLLVVDLAGGFSAGAAFLAALPFKYSGNTSWGWEEETKPSAQRQLFDGPVPGVLDSSTFIF